MATVRWSGKGTAVAQVGTGAITAYDAATTYTVTIGGETVSITGDTDVNTTAASLVTALEASTHPYFSAVAWTNPGAPSAAVVATANVAGVPFEAVLSVSGGTGTVTDFAATTDSAGPYHFDDPENWEGGAVPTTGDAAVIENSASLILYGLDGISDALASLTINKSFTGKIGMDRTVFSTNGSTTNSAVLEYRETYLKISAPVIDIGKHIGTGSPTGSNRIKIENILSGASVATVFGTASASSETTLPVVRYIAAHANADFIVISAPGGAGVAMDYTGETSTNGDLINKSASAQDKLFVGAGTTFTNYQQTGGTNIINGAAATVTLVKATGGILEINGNFTLTTLTNDGGTVTDNHIKTSTASVVTLNNTSGILDLNASDNARTITTLNQGQEAILKLDPNVVTVTNFNLPSDAYQLETNRVA